jgi:acetone carboxylase gamma subunit
MMGAYVDLTTPSRHVDECYECGKKFKKSETLKSGKKIVLDVYDAPWAAEPRVIAVHTVEADNAQEYGSCLDKLTDTSWEDFRYFDCPECRRLIARQCGYNGWRSYTKIVNDDEICVACYHKDVLENGMDPDFDNGIPGDFFSDADIEDHGWIPVHEIQNYHVGHKNAIDRVKKAAADLAAGGCLVLVNYDSMAYGGGEGFISMYGKKAGS